MFDHTRCAIVITDENGIILYVSGNEQLKKEVGYYGFHVGTQWLEACVGTNAIGACISLAQPVCILGDEHYVKRAKNYGCAAAPIRDPFSGEIIGALNLTCRLQDFHVFSLSAIEMLSEIIENTLRSVANTPSCSSQGLILDTFLEACKEADIHDGLVAIDTEGTILASNKALHAMLESDRNMPLRNLFERYPVLRGKFDASVAMPESFSTRLYGNSNERNTYLASFFPIHSDDSRLEGWLGRLLTISSGDASPERASEGTPLQPIYVSPSMSSVVRMAKKVAGFSSTKLLLGESGVGKEVLARYIHAHGTRASQPFIALNCAALPKELMASELFGYEPGAFTGARPKGKPGAFQLANRGTMYLDEIGDMPIELQSYLLRVIEEKKISRLGGTDTIPIDVQIIASTHRDLRRLVKEKKFRLDLYYRLNVISISIPPLRERKEDILPLAEFFLETVGCKLDGVRKRLSSHVKEAFLRYDWPGNIRELENVIEMAHAISEGEVIGPEHLHDEILSGTSGFSEPSSGEHPLPEEDTIRMAIRMCEGNMSKAAESLRVSRTTLYRKMTKYGIPLKSDGKNK